MHPRTLTKEYLSKEESFGHLSSIIDPVHWC